MEKREEKWGVQIKYSEMDRETEREAKHIIYFAVTNESNEQKIAEKIKTHMDKKYNGGWHVIVGRDYGLDVTHEEGTFIQATKGPLEIIIYRC